MTGPTAAPNVDTRHYLALCAVCLAMIFLVQLEAGLLITNLLSVLVGAIALVGRLRAGPLLLLVVVAGAQLSRQIFGGRYVDIEMPHMAMDLGDVTLCAAVLGYVAGHY